MMATLGNLGYAYGQRDDPRALPAMRQALTLARQIDDKIGCLYGILLFATYMIQNEEPERGVRLLGAAEACRIRMGLQPITNFDVPTATASAREQLGERGFTATWLAGQNMSLEQAAAAVLEAPGARRAAAAT